jgi:hypothetical protein
MSNELPGITACPLHLWRGAGESLIKPVSLEHLPYIYSVVFLDAGHRTFFCLLKISASPFFACAKKGAKKAQPILNAEAGLC